MKLSIYEIPNGYHARKEGKPCKRAVEIESLVERLVGCIYKRSKIDSDKVSVAMLKQIINELDGSTYPRYSSVETRKANTEVREG